MFKFNLSVLYKIFKINSKLSDEIGDYLNVSIHQLDELSILYCTFNRSRVNLPNVLTFEIFCRLYRNSLFCNDIVEWLEYSIDCDKT